MIPYPNIDPVFFKLGPIQLRWYGLAYIVGLLLGVQLIKKELINRCQFTHDQVYEFMTYCIVGVFLGGRLGYVLFYQFDYYLSHPSKILAIWQGGMSYHGGAIGAMLGILLLAKKIKKNPWQLIDLLAIGSTIAVAIGRIANFINGELYGRVTDVPWAMVFPMGGPELRHPSQLYESFGEGILLGLVLWVILKKVNPKPGVLFGLYLMGYGIVRFIIEFFREPDAHLGAVLGFLSMGQCLCIVMVGLGVGVVVYRSNRRIDDSVI